MFQVLTYCSEEFVHVSLVGRVSPIEVSLNPDYLVFPEPIYINCEGNSSFEIQVTEILLLCKSSN